MPSSPGGSHPRLNPGRRWRPAGAAGGGLIGSSPISGGDLAGSAAPAYRGRRLGRGL